MIVSDETLRWLQWLWIVVAAGFGIALRVTPKGQWKRSLIFSVVAIVALVLAIGEKGMGRPIVVVRRAPGAPTDKTRGVLYGSRDYTFLDGHHARLGGGEGTLVVNDSASAAWIRSINYGSIAIPVDPEPVAPMSLHDAKYGVDYVGPDDHPPSEVSSNISFAIKYWLTWGD